MSDPPIEIVSRGPVSGRLIAGESPASADARAAAPMTPPRDPATPWRAGLATGLGSLPGTDPQDAAALVAGELPDLPHLAELPDRGPGADMLGRALAVCVDLPAEVTPFGWRLARRPGSDIRRARDFLRWDLDAAEQHYAGAPWVKVQVTGPWTLAAHVETPSGNRAVTDEGAVRDLAASLTEGLAEQVAELSRRLPGSGVIVQIDEPSLPMVLNGSLPTASGFGAVQAIAAADAEQLLAGLVDALAGQQTVVHCCHPEIPLALLRRAGFHALSLDLSASMTLPATALDQIGEAVEAGTVLFAGMVPTREPLRRGEVPPGSARDIPPGSAARDIPPGSAARDLDFKAVAAPVLGLWQRLGLPDRSLAQVVVTPTCGLAGATPEWTRRALALTRDTAQLLADRAMS